MTKSRVPTFESEPGGVLVGPDDPRQYVRIAVDLPNNIKMNAMSDPLMAIAASVIAICIAAESFTDGLVPLNALRRAGVSETIIKEMIAEDVWHDLHHECKRCTEKPKSGWIFIHDYLRHQRSSAMVKELRQKRSAAGALGAERRWAGLRAAQAQERAKGETPAVSEEVVDPKKAKILEDSERLCNYLAGWIEKNHSKNERPSVGKAWLNDMRKMIEIDGLTVEEIKEIISWTQRHHFWNDKIRSPHKLRQKIKEHDFLRRMKSEPVGVGNSVVPINGQRRSASASRAEAALTLAEELDAEMGATA